ncbi:MAG: hypothetical protein AAF676_15250 [Pseudomonadota bacterium]
MARRLIIHCLPPDAPGDALQRRYFDPCVPARRRMALSDPLHALRTRYPETTPLPGPLVRLVSGPAPFRYFDGADDTAVYVLVLGDPAEMFLRGARRVLEAGIEDGRRVAGPGFQPRPGDDLDATALRLLEADWARRTRLNPLTRLCAGAPLAAAEAEGSAGAEALLRAAEANLARTNLLVGFEGALNGFARYLAGVFGWTPPAHALEPSSAKARRSGPLHEAVRPETLAAVREATRLDAALLQAARQAEPLEV